MQGLTESMMLSKVILTLAQCCFNHESLQSQIIAVTE